MNSSSGSRTAEQEARARRGRASRRRGASLEREAWAWYRSRGYVVVGNTHGAFDLMAAKPGELLVVEVKGTQEAFGDFGPDDRYALLMAADQAGAQPRLWHKRKYAKTPDIYPPDQWPAFRKGHPGVDYSAWEHSSQS